MTDILAAIDAAIGCQQCGKPFPEDPKLHVSDDFCRPDCQEAWHASRSAPSMPDGGLASEVPEWAPERWRPERRGQRGNTPALAWVDEMYMGWADVDSRIAESEARHRPYFEELFRRVVELGESSWREPAAESRRARQSALDALAGQSISDNLVTAPSEPLLCATEGCDRRATRAVYLVATPGNPISVEICAEHEANLVERFQR